MLRNRLKKGRKGPIPDLTPNEFKIDFRKEKRKKTKDTKEYKPTRLEFNYFEDKKIVLEYNSGELCLEHPYLRTFQLKTPLVPTRLAKNIALTTASARLVKEHNGKMEDLSTPGNYCVNHKYIYYRRDPETGVETKFRLFFSSIFMRDKDDSIYEYFTSVILERELDEIFNLQIRTDRGRPTHYVKKEDKFADEIEELFKEQLTETKRDVFKMKWSNIFKQK